MSKINWTPRVGMKIRYRRDNKHPQHDMSVVATILSISEFDQRLTIERDRGAQRLTSLSQKTWLKTWEPVPDQDEAQKSSLTEADVRRIVREEISKHAETVSDALRRGSDWIIHLNEENNSEQSR